MLGGIGGDVFIPAGGMGEPGGRSLSEGLVNVNVGLGGGVTR